MAAAKAPNEVPKFYALNANSYKFTDISDISILVTSGTVTITNSAGQSLTYSEDQEPRLSRNDGNLIDELTVDATSGAANVIFYGATRDVELL